MKPFSLIYLKGLIWVVLCMSGINSVNAQLGVTNNPFPVTPQSLLHVHDDHANGQILQLTNNTSGYTMPTFGFSIQLDPNFKTIFKNQYNHTGASISFMTNDGTDQERLTIKNNGNVGIGSTDPGFKLTVAGQLGLLETGVSPWFYTVLQSANLSSQLTFTLPSGYGSAGQVLSTDGSGAMSWASGEVPLTFSNGLNRSLSTIKWGGSLTEHTTITQSGSQVLSFTNSGAANTVFNLTGTGDFDIQDNGTSVFYVSDEGKIGIGNISPTNKLDIIGDVFLTYPGASNGVIISGSTSYALGYCQNSYPGNTWGFSAGCSSTSAGSSSYGAYGFNYGAGYGIFGRAYASNGTGVHGINEVSSNYGSLGTDSYGVYGSSYGNNYGYIGGLSYGVYGSYGTTNHGYIGGANYGIFGQYSSSGNYGHIGGTDNAVYGYLIGTNPGNYALYGYGVHSSGFDGTNYTPYASLGAVKGYNYFGNPYTFAVAGFSDLDYDRSGGTLGGRSNGTTWGCLGYQNSGGTEYGGYFTSYTSGSGKSPSVMVNSGISAWGDLFGADIHGHVYGLYTEGSDYASYANGTVFKNGLDVHLQKKNNGDNITLYTNVSTSATVQTCGYANLSGGLCDVGFDPSFTAAVSSSSPVIVTITPMGNTQGVYLTSVGPGGFTVSENNNGKSNVQISYIAIGKRAGYETPALPDAVVAGDYTDKVFHGLHNDNDRQTGSNGLYYDNGVLYTGAHPSALPDPNKPALDPNLKQSDLSTSGSLPGANDPKKNTNRGDGRVPK
jgi:hypothetical protein